MYSIDFSRPCRLHFIGIGGISMSGLAEVLLDEGFAVSGSDRAASALTDHLKGLGADIFIGQKAENIPEDADAVVYTAAIKADNPELAEAVRRGLPLLTRAELLGELMANYPDSIAVAGTHGKTTTTSMLAHILLAADADPTVSVGGILPAIGGNIRIGKSGSFLTEACEYTNSFLALSPKVGVILNVDADHLDFFKDLDDITRSFRKFAEKIPADGTLVIDSGCHGFGEITKDLPCRVVTFSESDAGADVAASDIEYNNSGCASFTVNAEDCGAFSVCLQVPGSHNISNALAAAAAALSMGLSEGSIAEGLGAFGGTKRRFEEKGSVNGAAVVDDYAHHPTEIAATLAAAKRFPHENALRGVPAAYLLPHEAPLRRLRESPLRRRQTPSARRVRGARKRRPRHFLEATRGRRERLRRRRLLRAEL